MILSSRIALATAASALSLAFAGTAAAQQASPNGPTAGAGTGTAQTSSDAEAAPQSSADASAPDTGAEIVVTGTRAPGRSRLDTVSPVDVLSINSLRQQGTTELATALANVAPSIDFPRPSATDATDAVRPATLRGLSPDETLVLINNVRAHPSASLNVNGSVGRGASAVDLNTVPTAALERIEVLRDGASAQYGSDAIAGVINLRLREAREGGGATVTYGLYDTDVDTARGSRHVTGESTTTVSGWKGLGFGDDGFLTLSGEYLYRLPTNRSDYPAATAVAPAGGPPLQGRLGDPYVNQYTVFANAGSSISADWKVYGWAGYQSRHTSSAAFPRPTSAGTVGSATLAGYPAGFLPLIDTLSTDVNAALGIKGTLAGWTVDLNGSYGRNKVRFRTENSANYAYGAATPHSFYDGALIYDQWVGNLDVSRQFDLFQSFNVAFGLEGRREGFKITPGEQASYGYPTTGAVAGASPGAQGFGGFAPRNAIERHRENGSAYLDLEAQLTEGLRIEGAVRGESYSDFGEVGTGKLSARYDFGPHFAIRGTVSTGFRAPSLQQQYYTSVSSVITNGQAVLTGTYPSTDPVARALGGQALRPEKSTNFSAGTIIRFGGLDITVDGYYIKLRDQLALSENISATNPAVAALFAQNGITDVSAARFFINGVRSTAQGIDAVAHYRLHGGGAGVFDLTLAGNVNKIDVTRVPTTTSTLNPAPTLFARSRVLTLEQGTPGEKVSGTVDWSLDQLGATVRVTYYGDVNEPGTVATSDIHTGRHTITDLEFRYRAEHGLEFALGAQNLFDIYPNQTPAAISAPSGVLGYPFYSPFGFNGRYLYARAGLSW